ncbi:sortase domain-bontaining protein [Aeromicrobium sp. CTD01-1L150]|uniref:sortase domain-containing protein n=1 Tax=Aeromicrobium sp. CTD01-1L150 TaxID=3341830 RepID=UPI0035C0C72F
MSTTSPEKPRRRARRRRNPVLALLGLSLVVAGLGILGWGAWQYWGTNIVAKQEHAQIREVIADDWGNGMDSDAIGLLRVERWGDDYEVPIVKGFEDEDLARGVGWYEEGVMPGEVGNFAIAGHRVTHGEPFRDFLELREGDLVEVETRTHIYTYELENAGDSLTLDFTVGWPLQPVPDPDLRGEQPTEPKLTMLTCSELFHTRDRNVVFGDLVDEVEKDVAEA